MRCERTLPSSPFFGIGLIKNTGPDRQHGVRFRKSQKKNYCTTLLHMQVSLQNQNNFRNYFRGQDGLEPL